MSTFKADDARPESLRVVLNIEADAAAREKTMEKEPSTEAASPAPQEETMTKKKTGTGTKGKSPKVKPPKAAKQAKPKKERPPKEPTPGRVFAIRVTDEELAAIHKASGPRNATRFIRAVAAAFAAEDEGAFKAVLKEAREARS